MKNVRTHVMSGADGLIFREHEINSYIGSGYDLWRDDNVTRDGEGLYRFDLTVKMKRI